MTEHVYVLTGRIIPERAILQVSEIRFLVAGGEDVPQGGVSIEIVNSQVFATYKSQSSVKNIFTLRNIIEDAVRLIADVAGFWQGYGYDVEIVQMLQPATGEKYVYGIDVPALAGVCETAGVSFMDIFPLAGGPDGYFLRHALGDVREAMKSPKDTGFFCYRAIESLKNFCASSQNISGGGLDTQWRAFRKKYGVERKNIMKIKSFADPVRHGNYLQARPVSDADRASIFKATWDIINKFVLVEKAARSS